MKREKEIKEFVTDRYAKIALNGDFCCQGCTCNTDLVEQAKSVGYSVKELYNGR